MVEQKRVGIGLIGAGFLAETRARCYAQVSGYNAQIVAVAARTETSAAKWGVSNINTLSITVAVSLGLDIP